MAYYLGKGINRPMDSDIFNLFRKTRQAAEVPENPLSIPATPATVPAVPEPIPKPTPETGGETPTGTENYADALLKSMFGMGFEDVMRGRGAGARESVYDMLAREGLLGTGAVKGVGQEMAWQTERGVADVLRGIEQVKYEREQDAVNRLLSLFFNLMGGWQ